MTKSLSSFMVALSLLFTTILNFEIITIVYNATGWKMPRWLAWTLTSVAGVSVVVAMVATYGGVTIAPAVAKAIIAADGVSL